MIYRFTRFLIRYKVFHLLYWGWAFTTFLHYRHERFGGSTVSQVPVAIIIYGFQVLLVYSMLYLLVPRFLRLRKYFLFSALTMLSIISAGILTAITIMFYNRMTQPAVEVNLLLMSVSTTVDIILVALIFLSADIIYKGYLDEQRNRQLEKEKLETELSFLKSQLNPHFLFNALNNIYVLIEEDKEIATETLLKFSSLLRYQLYECRENITDVSRELNFIRDYTELEQLRSSDSVKVSFENSVTKPFNLAPFLLMPFVENAFKHVSRDGNNVNYIKINSELNTDTFTFSVMNTKISEGMRQNNGIGLSNVKRRLELLYPRNHELIIASENGTYNVTLRLYVDKAELHHR